jgi:hypothetical protein
MNYKNNSLMITIIHQKSIKQIRIIKLTNLEQIKNIE